MVFWRSPNYITFNFIGCLMNIKECILVQRFDLEISKFTLKKASLDIVYECLFPEIELPLNFSRIKTFYLYSGMSSEFMQMTQNKTKI